MYKALITTGLVSLLLFCCISRVDAAEALRIGHFPNMTHAQPLVGRAQGIFEKKIGTPIDWKVFNAGPSEMEALLAGQLDIAYVGPNPAVNAFLRSKGKSLKVIAGAASGGASLVIPFSSKAVTAKDFKGKRIASPELGNTQDVALRNWLKGGGVIPGKDVNVIPIRNADILMLFQQGKLDGAWVPEPWVTRLIREGGGRILLDERKLWKDGKFPTTVVVVRTAYLAKNRDLVARFLAAHVEVTEWIGKNPEAARKQLNEQLARIVGKPFAPQLLDEAFGRVSITYDPLESQLLTSARWAAELGYLPKNTDLSGGMKGLFDITILNDLLAKRKIPRGRGK